MAGLVLGCGEGHSSAPVDPGSGDLSNLMSGRRSETALPRAFTEPAAVAAWRAWTCDSKTEARDQRRNLKNQMRCHIGGDNLQATLESAAESWARTTVRSDCTTSSSAVRR
jgi:hypothetical protein